MESGSRIRIRIPDLDGRQRQAESGLRPAAVLLAVSDEEELERLVLAHTPRFMAMLAAAERRIKRGRGVKHREFWKSVKKR